MNFTKSLSFFLRNQITWGRAYRENGVGNRFVLEGPWKELARKYQFEKHFDHLNRHSLLLNLSKFHQLENLLPEGWGKKDTPLRILDVGSQNFVYAPALHHFFSNENNEVFLKGLEIDGHRRYLTLHTRRNLADYYASLTPNTYYEIGDFLQWDPSSSQDVIVMFRPFILQGPVDQAGLPKRVLNPSKLMECASQTLHPGGVLILSFQEETECETAQESLKNSGFQAEAPIFWSPPSGSIEARGQWLQRASKK